MDFASMVSVNNKSRVDFEQAGILTGCQFAKTRGEIETEKKAKSNIFPTKDAKIVVLLSDHAGKIWY